MKIIGAKKNLCSRCPYTLGVIQTVTNPCPACKLNGYNFYEWFRKQLSGESSDSSNGNGYDELSL